MRHLLASLAFALEVVWTVSASQCCFSLTGVAEGIRESITQEDGSVLMKQASYPTAFCLDDFTGILANSNGDNCAFHGSGSLSCYEGAAGE